MRRLYTLLSSNRFAIFNFLFLAVNLIILKLFNINTLAFVSLALIILFLNLLFCFIKHRGFARRTMTVFHLILMLFILVSAYGSLYFFYGYLELAEGQREDKGYQKYVKGPLHRNTLDEIAVYQGKIVAKYKDDYNTDINSFIRIYKKKVRDKGSRKVRLA